MLSLSSGLALVELGNNSTKLRTWTVLWGLDGWCGTRWVRFRPTLVLLTRVRLIWEGTLKLVSNVLWWKQMSNSIEEYVEYLQISLNLSLWQQPLDIVMLQGICHWLTSSHRCKEDTISFRSITFIACIHKVTFTPIKCLSCIEMYPVWPVWDITGSLSY